MDREFEELLKSVLKELKDLTVILKTTSKAAKQTAIDQKQSQTFLRQNIVRLKEEIKQRKKSGESFDELEKEIDQGKVELRGCCVYPHSKQFRCNDCLFEWGKV